MRLLLTEKEVCQTLSLSRSTLRRLMAQGAIRSIRIGRSIRFPMVEVERFVTEVQAQNAELEAQVAELDPYP